MPGFYKVLGFKVSPHTCTAISQTQNISSHWSVPVIHFLLFLCEKSSGHNLQLFVTRKPLHSTSNSLVSEESLAEETHHGPGPKQ